MADEQLNEQQRGAVEYAGGPLLVLAGPGAGKTRVITRRIARLVDEGAAPETILAVTFTTKAAAQMRTRLCDLIGVSAAERIHLGTFHGFGLRLMQRFADLIGLPHEPHIIDSAQRKRLLREALAEEDVEPERLAAGWDSIIDHAQRWIARFNNNALSPAHVAAAIKSRRAALDANDEGLDDLALAGERAELGRLALTSRLFTRFDALCRQRGWLTLDDLITLPAQLMDRYPSVRDIVHADLRHVVVDEFQDVNGAQIELLRRIAPPERTPDLCVVGDDDQAIYMFRGADDQALAHFSSIWTGHKTVRLTLNYRSDKQVLDVANAVITRADTRYEPDKTIVPALDPKPGAGVECVTLEQHADEPAVVAAMLLESVAANPDVPLHKYAVIARTHLDLERIGEALRIEGIRFVPARESGAAEDDAVKDVLAWIRLLIDPDAAAATIRVLARPPLAMAPADIVGLLNAHRAARSRKGAAPFADFVIREGASHPAIRRFKDIRVDLAKVASGVSADRAIWSIIERTDPAHAELLPPGQRAQRIESLVALLKFARDKTPRLEEPADLAAFWSYREDLDRNEQNFELITRETVDGADDEHDRTLRGVQLLTTFGAKGLEFDTVFVPRVFPAHGYPKSGSDDLEDVPAWLSPWDQLDATIKERRIAEERRIFYVACTRAERRLILISVKQQKRSKAVHYFHELTYDEPDLVTCRDQEDITDVGAVESASLGLTDVKTSIIDRAKRTARAEAAQALHQADDPDIGPDALDRISDQLQDAAMRLGAAASLARGVLPEWLSRASTDTQAWAHGLASRLENDDARRAHAFAPLKPPLSLSFSAIKSYVDCPMCYYIRNVLKLREPDSDAQLLGKAAHDALQWLYEQHQEADAGAATRPAKDDVIARGHERLEALASGRIVPKSLMEQLEAQLTLAMDRLDDPRVEVLNVEKHDSFPYVHKDIEHTMTARIDRIDRLPDGRFRIVDYKTGREKQALLEPPPGDLQFAIYAKALAHIYPAGDGSIPDGVAEYWVLASGRRGVIDLATLKLDKADEKIGKAIDGILAGEFERMPKCKGPCTLFAHDLDPQPLLFGDV